MIQSIAAFVSYFEGIRRRTLNYVRAIPADKVDWQWRAGEFSCRDILLHLAAAETMFVNAFVSGKWKYDAAHRDPEGVLHQLSLPELVAHLEQTHVDAMNALRATSDTELEAQRPMLEGDHMLKGWRLLMMLVEHEIHHRSQLATTLALMGVEPPQIYGLSIEDVIARATG